MTRSPSACGARVALHSNDARTRLRCFRGAGSGVVSESTANVSSLGAALPWARRTRIPRTVNRHTTLTTCIEACQDAHAASERALVRATARGAGATTPQLVRILIDCAEATQTAANFMLRGSELHAAACRACESVCEAGAEACLDADAGADLSPVHDALRHCADECRAMAETQQPTHKRGEPL